MKQVLWTIGAILVAILPAGAQDIRGLEVCTSEKTMERRTSCLQSNVEFLQQALAKHERQAKAEIAAAQREAAAQKAEIAALKDAVAELHRELADLKKAKPAK